MKKFTKIIGIFLCLSMIVGMLSVVGAVDPEPTVPAAPTGAILQGDYLEVVSPTRIETIFGYYSDRTGADENTLVDCEDGACVTDGWFGRAGYSECTSADGLIALYMMVDDFVNLGGIEIVCKDAAHAAAKFDVQVMGEDGWETVVSVASNPFTDNLTKTFTFDAVETDTVRILVHEVATNDQCYFNEVTLFETKTGNLKTVLDLNGRIAESNLHTNYPANQMVDGDKSNLVLGHNVVLSFDEATAIDGFALYYYRSNQAYGNEVTINIQKTEGGEFETIGTYATGFGGDPQDSLYVTFDQTHMAYAVQVLLEKNAYFVEFELWQYQREGSVEEPTEAPTEEPTEAPTEAPTEEPTEAPTEAPTVIPTEPVATLQKIDLSGTIVGTCSISYSSDVSNANQNWYSTQNAGWRDLGRFVDGDYSTDVSFGVSEGERGDFYADLTRKNGSAISADQLMLYYAPTSSSNSMPTVTIILELADGTQVEETFTTNWAGRNSADPLTWTFGQTYEINGVYVYSANAPKVGYAEFELYALVGGTTEPTTPTEPTEAPTEEPTEAPTQAPTQAPAPTYTWMDLIPESSITPAVGYFVNGDYTVLTDINPEESPLLTNAHVGNNTWINGTAFPVPAGKVPGAMLDLGANKLIAAVELVGEAGNRITSFDIAVLNANGEWQDVYTTTDAPYVGSTLKLVLDTPVVGSKIRIVIHDWDNEHPVLKEVFVYEGKTTDALVQVPVTNITANQDPVTPAYPIDKAIDGDKFSYYQIGPGNMPAAITLDTTNADGSATNISRMRIFAFHSSKYAPGEIVIEVKTANEPETWETVYTGTAYALGHTDTFTVDFGATYAAYDVRLTVNTFTAANLIMTEVELFGNGEPVTPPVVTPTDPTETPTEAPTETPTETPTEPAGSIELPETPVVAPGGESVIGIPKTGNVFKIVSPTKLTTVFGFYGADGAFVDKNDGYCVTDGWYGRAGYSECTTANGTIGLIMTLDEATNIGAIEMVGKDADHNPVDFEVQAMVNGEWVTVLDVNEDPFTAGLTKTFTFASVETSQVRVLINKVSVETNQCYFSEVSLFEVTTGKLFNKINLTGRVTSSDAHSSHPATNFVDADKSTLTLLNNVTINLTEAGQPTAVDGLALYHYRGGQSQPTIVTVNVQKTEGGEFETIGAFNTNWSNTYPLDSLFVEFDQTYVAYAMTVTFDTYAYAHEFELIQFVQDPAPVEPPVEPDPTEPTVAPTEPTVAPTEPSVTPTEPTVAPTEPSETPTEPSEPTDEPIEPGEELDYSALEDAFALLDTMDPADYTEESVAELEAVLMEVIFIMSDENATQEMIDEATQMLLDAIDALVLIEEPGTDEPGVDLPDVPELPGAPDLTDIQATIDKIYDLDPDKYTAESYENLIIVVKEVNKILATEGGYNQKMLDRANEMLTEALAALVPVDGGNDAPGGEDDDLPAPTGDIALAVMTGLMSLSAIGGAVVIGKKKFF